MWSTATEYLHQNNTWWECPINWIRKIAIGVSKKVKTILDWFTSVKEKGSNIWSAMITRRQAIKAWIILGAVVFSWSAIALWAEVLLDKKITNEDTIRYLRNFAFIGGAFTEKKVWDNIILTINYSDEKAKVFESYECIEITANERILSKVACDFYNDWSKWYSNWWFKNSDFNPYEKLVEWLNSKRLWPVVNSNSKILIPIRRLESEMVRK